jgi:hypothetical protein
MNGTANRGSGGGFKEQGSRDSYDKRDYNRESRDNSPNIGNSSQSIPNNLSRDYANFLNNSKENSAKYDNDNHGNNVRNMDPDSRIHPDDSHSNGNYMCMINTRN